MNARGRQFWHLVQWQLAEARHQRVVGVLAAVAVLGVAMASVLRSFNFGAAEPRFFAQVARAGLWGTGVMIAALVGPALVQGGVKAGSAAALFARGVSRWAWVAATIVALWTALAWLTLLVAAGLAALLVWHGHAGAWGAAALLARDLGALLVLANAAVLFSALFGQPTPASLATVGLALAAALAPIVERMAARSEGMERGFWTVLDWAVPNFAALVGAPGSAGLVWVSGYAAAYAVAAGLIFSRREL